MFHACATRFDVTGNLEFFLQNLVNRALIYDTSDTPTSIKIKQVKKAHQVLDRIRLMYFEEARICSRLDSSITMNEAVCFFPFRL